MKQVHAEDPGTLLRGRHSRETLLGLREGVCGGCPPRDPGWHRGIADNPGILRKRMAESMRQVIGWPNTRSPPLCLPPPCSLENVNIHSFQMPTPIDVAVKEREASLLRMCGDPLFPNWFSTLRMAETGRRRDGDDR